MQEDSPDEIGQAIAAWLERMGLADREGNIVGPGIEATELPALLAPVLAALP